MKYTAVHIILALMLVFASLELNATKAVPKIQKITQPDGTQVSVMVAGDHIFGYKLTLAGEMVELGPDGFLHYVELTPAGRRLTERRVSDGNPGGYGRWEPYQIREIRQGNAPHFARVYHVRENCRETKSSPNVRKYPVLLVEFEDVKFTVDKPKDFFNTLLNAASGSAADYFNTNFAGICTFAFRVGDVISLPYPVADFGAHSGTFNDMDVTRLLKETCKAASEAGYDFSSFDTDGDGIVDNVAIIFAGHNESEGGSPDAIWPHQQDVSGEDITFNGVKIASYSCTSELKGAQGNEPSTIGTFCHEFAHSLGLPDLYDTNGDIEGLSAALYGSLSIMDKGNFLDDGRTPPLFSAIEREILGIGEIVDLKPDTSYVLSPASVSHTVYRVNTSNDGEYFLFEFRNRSRWDRYIGGSGLVAYHVDKSRSVNGGLSSSDRWKYNNVNALASHECARVLAAAPAEGSAGALFYPGTANVFELTSQEGHSMLKDWGGFAVGIGLKDIRQQGSRVYFNTIRDYSFNDTLPHAVDCKAISYQNDARLQWKGSSPEGYDGGDVQQWLVSWNKVGEDKTQSMVSDSTVCYIRGLEPGCRYAVRIFCIEKKEFGEPVEMEVATAPVTSLFPYIYLNRKGYRTGDILDLRVFNLVEQPHAAAWRVNGKSLGSDSYVIGEEDEVKIELTIEYKDGSREKIYKVIRVD
ncbi:MAG: M6 family metalloprotease domain-containing protein [Bacteroidales bacterium]|nr:M6 family metalloprotease domain-containing protein [Bacteroidales bacterium]